MTRPGSVLVTGAAGFLGSHAVRSFVAQGTPVVGLDALTYAGDLARLDDAGGRFSFDHVDVTDRVAVRRSLASAGPRAVVHFAAETHVTRSAIDPDLFARTNVVGTRVMLEEAARAGAERFIHISTDEVYGPALEGAFREEDKRPGTGQATSPYAKSKAVADDVATAFGTQSEMSVVVLRPTNCFGPAQFPEKALARWIVRALLRRPLPIWGDGLYVRQWLHAGALVEAVQRVLDAADPEPVYNVAPRHDPEITNLDLARWLLDHLGLPQDRLVFTAYDRPDHDRRYAVDPSRIEALGWRAGDLHEVLAATVNWYRMNAAWWRRHLAEAESIYVDVPPVTSEVLA